MSILACLRSTLRSVNTRKICSFIHKFIDIALSNAQLIVCASYITLAQTGVLARVQEFCS